MPGKRRRWTSEAHHTPRKGKAEVSFYLSEEVIHCIKLIPVSRINLTKAACEPLIRLFKESQGIHKQRRMIFLMLYLLPIVLVDLLLTCADVEVVFPKETIKTTILTIAQGFPSTLYSRNFLESLRFPLRKIP